MTEQILTQARLKQILHYNPVTGIFTRLITRSSKAIAGMTVGTINNGYLFVSIDNTLHRIHRLAFLYMEGKMPPHEVDHINHNRSDNRWSNIRKVTRTENSRNTTNRTTNKSGTIGVSICKQTNQWRATITVNGSSIHLGRFCDKKAAASARQVAEKKYGFHKNHGL